MTAIGHVTKNKDGSYKGQLKTLSFRAPIDILPNTAKNGDNQPDYLVYSQAVAIGAGTPEIRGHIRRSWYGVR